MIEIRFHGRGGQGTVVASKTLAEAIFREGKYVQTFPEYGVERRGAPVTAFTRIDENPIYIRTKVYEPQYIVVLDPTLIEAVDVTEGLKEGGFILINSEKSPKEYTQFNSYKVATVDATSIAIKYKLGSKAAPIVNTSILGAFAKATGLVKLESILSAVYEVSPFKKEENKKAAQEAYEKVII